MWESLAQFPPQLNEKGLKHGFPTFQVSALLIRLQNHSLSLAQWCLLYLIM